MPKHRIRLEGPGLRGLRVNASLLRDLLQIVIDGSRKAVRLRAQGRSTARGTPPAWIPAAADFTIEIVEGSTAIEIEAPTLLSADPEGFSQRNLFPDIDPENTSFDYFTESLYAAIHADQESPLVDQPMITLLTKLEGVFEHGVDSVQFYAGHRFRRAPLLIREQDVRGIADLTADIPPPQHVRVAAKLDIIRHSDGTFYLVLPTGERVRGIAHADQLGDLQGLWGLKALVAGTAYFSPAGRVLRIEAQAIRRATEKDTQLWALSPEPMELQIRETPRRTRQGPRSGLNAIFGQWPGDEDDETIQQVLEALS